MNNNNSCVCAGYNCSCCEHLDIPQIHVNETGCVNISYLPQEYGVDLSFSINGYVFYEEKFSGRTMIVSSHRLQRVIHRRSASAFRR